MNRDFFTYFILGYKSTNEKDKLNFKRHIIPKIKDFFLLRRSIYFTYAGDVIILAKCKIRKKNVTINKLEENSILKLEEIGIVIVIK